MTDLNKRLAEEYIVDYNITKAAERAGIEGDNARIVAWQMLQLPDVKEYVSLLRFGQSERTMVTADRVQSEIARLAFSDIREYYDDNGLLLSPKQLSDDAAAALAGIEVDEMFDSIGFKIGDTKKIKLYDKLNALDKLARRLGMFSEDNAQKNTTFQIMNVDPLNGTETNDSTQEDIGT